MLILAEVGLQILPIGFDLTALRERCKGGAKEARAKKSCYNFSEGCYNYFESCYSFSESCNSFFLTEARRGRNGGSMTTQRRVDEDATEARRGRNGGSTVLLEVVKG